MLNRKTPDIDYKNAALIVVKPSSRVISTHRVKDKKEHRQILDRAIEKQYVVYFATVTHRDGKYYAAQPWFLDYDSVPKPQTIKSEPEPESEPEKTGLYCPYCDSEIKSTPGRTLHVKSKHPKKIEEYKVWLKSLGKN